MKKQRTSGSKKTAGAAAVVAVPVAPLAYVPFERTATGGVPCPWCKKDCDAGFRCPVIAKPCLHVGCMDCVRRAVAPASMNSHKQTMCPVCAQTVRTFTIEGAPISRVVAAVVEEKKAEEKAAVVALSSKGKEEQEEQDVGGVMAMELDELKQLRGTEPDETWVCIVCAFNYDNATRVPVCVSACYAIAADPHMPKLDRGLAPGCGHNICEQCMLELFAKGDPTCYTCRAYIKDFGINVPLLRKIAAFRGGYYLSLVLQLNDSAKKQHEMTMAFRKREEDFKRFDTIKVAADERKTQLEECQKQLSAARTGRDEFQTKYNAANNRANTLDQQCAKATERLRAAMGINKMLYDEVIALRLQAMEAGLIPRSQLGLEYDVEQSVDKVVLKVLSRDRKTTMYYGRRWKELSSEERGAIDRIRTHNKREREGEAGELACLPTDDEIEQSHKATASGQPLVRVGSWLHERIMSKVNTVEATFDAPSSVGAGGGGGMVEEMAMYCAVSSEALVIAVSAYERMRKEARSRPPPPQPVMDVDPSAPDVTVGKGRELCPNCQLFFACGDTKINCNHLAPVVAKEDGWLSREEKERLTGIYSDPAPPGIGESDLPSPLYQPSGRETQTLRELLALPIGAAVKTLHDNSALLDWLSNASNYRRLLTGEQGRDIKMLVKVARHPLARAGNLKGAVCAVFPNLVSASALQDIDEQATDLLRDHFIANGPPGPVPGRIMRQPDLVRRAGSVATEADYCFVGARDGVDRISAGPLVMPPFRPLETGEVLPMPEWIQEIRRQTAPQQQQQQAAREASDFAVDFLPSHAAAASPEDMLRAVAAHRAQIAREGGGGGEGVPISVSIGASRNAGAAPVTLSIPGLHAPLLGVESARQRLTGRLLAGAVGSVDGFRGLQPPMEHLDHPFRLAEEDADERRAEEANNNDADRAPESMFDL